MAARFITAIVLALGLLLPVPAAEAQDGETVQERAAALHADGIAALDELAFPRARDLFERSLDLFADLGTAFNLGLAYKGTGQLRQALSIWDRVAGGEFGEVTGEPRAQLIDEMEEVRSQLATLTIRVLGPDVAQVSIDGEDETQVRQGSSIEFEANPGRRVVAVTAAGYRDFLEAVTLRASGTGELTADLEPLPDPTESPGVFAHPVFWTVVGVLVLGAAAAAVYVLTGPHFEDPNSREPFGSVTTLRAP